jgi:hypothetical protein
MATKIKGRSKLPKPPNCGPGKVAVWVKADPEKKEPGKRPTPHRDDKKIPGKGKWVCKVKKGGDDKNPNRPKRPDRPPSPNDPKRYG